MIDEQVALILFLKQVTIATIQPVKTELVLALSAYNSKTSSVTSIFIFKL